MNKLQSLGIKQAWAGSYEGVLHRDLGGVNERLVKACREAPQGMLVPMGTVNPALPGWEDDLRKCHGSHAMPGVRLYPSYHGYTLDDSRFISLLASATKRGLLVQIVVALEDRRTQHPLLQVPDVNLEPLPRILASFEDAKVMLLNYRPAGTLAAQLAKTPQIVFDTARVEGADGIARLMRTASPQRVLHGSHAPFLVMESSLIKFDESELDREQIGSLLSENAVRLLAC
ncbi:amidohydrolase family protein [Candidatus Laterigemmans baculatus]|uniref:amidohydrolase family protein n=1 Tax=Candidatus Laterigemmans baculatus TaxID=2770505 RepID=UPI0013DCE92B|nr:amidohydrolase family protein [Candidatus Laterigemmans baculatus]